MAHPKLDQLVSEFLKAQRYDALAHSAESLRTDPDLSFFEQGVSRIIWAYSLLRMRPHEHRERAMEAAQAGAQMVEEASSENPLGPWALYVYGLCFLLAGKYEGALAYFASLDVGRLSLPTQVKVGCGVAFALYQLGRREESMAEYDKIAQRLDAQDPQTMPESLLVERQRLRINRADYLLDCGAVGEAAAEIALVDDAHTTQLLKASALVTQARVALMRDQWDQANRLASQALEHVGDYAPIRIDALGVRIAVAGRLGRREDVVRMATEMATLATQTEGGVFG